MSIVGEEQRDETTSPDEEDRVGSKRRLRLPHIAWGAFALVMVAAVVYSRSLPAPADKHAAAKAVTGLPQAPDYHSLNVAPDDAKRVFLGTHSGLYESRDGGKSWSHPTALKGDAMNLSRGGSGTLYAAGHETFLKSTNGGRTWQKMPIADSIAEIRSIDHKKAVDIHGFSVDPLDPNVLWAAVNRHGLFRSADAGRTFTRISPTGADAQSVAVTPTKPERIYLGDAKRGLLLSQDGGKTWRALQASVVGVAIDPKDASHVLASGASIYESRDGIRFRAVQAGSPDGFGPVIFAPSKPSVAYAVDIGQKLYVSADGGSSWTRRP